MEERDSGLGFRLRRVTSCTKVFRRTNKTMDVWILIKCTSSCSRSCQRISCSVAKVEWLAAINIIMNMKCCFHNGGNYPTSCHNILISGDKASMSCRYGRVCQSRFSLWRVTIASASTKMKAAIVMWYRTQKLALQYNFWNRLFRSLEPKTDISKLL